MGHHMAVVFGLFHFEVIEYLRRFLVAIAEVVARRFDVWCWFWASHHSPSLPPMHSLCAWMCGSPSWVWRPPLASLTLRSFSVSAFSAGLLLPFIRPPVDLGLNARAASPRMTAKASACHRLPGGAVARREAKISAARDW